MEIASEQSVGRHSLEPSLTALLCYYCTSDRPQVFTESTGLLTLCGAAGVVPHPTQ